MGEAGGGQLNWKCELIIRKFLLLLYFLFFFLLLAMRFDFVQNVEDAKEKGERKEKGEGGVEE